MEVDKEPVTVALPPKHTEDSHLIQLSAEEARRKRNRLAQRKHRLREQLPLHILFPERQWLARHVRQTDLKAGVKSVGGEPMKHVTDATQDALEPKPAPHGTLVAQLPSGDVEENTSHLHTEPPPANITPASAVTRAASTLDAAAQKSLRGTADKPTSPNRQPMHDTTNLPFDLGELNRSELSLVYNPEIVPLDTATLCPTDPARSAIFAVMDHTLPDFHCQLDEFLNDMADLDDTRPLYDHSQPLQYTHPLTPMSKDMEGDVQMSNGPAGVIRTRNPVTSKTKPAQGRTRFDEAVGWDEENDSESDYEDNVSNLDRCFERIIEVVEEAGFASIDEMSATYYTARFAEDSVSYEAQSRSRSRLLQSFLQSVHTSTEHWSNREVQGYRRQIVAAAETVYMDEIVEARQALLARKVQRKGPPKAGGEDDGTATAQAMRTSNTKRIQKVWEAIAELDLENDVKNKRRQYRDKVCDQIPLSLELDFAQDTWLTMDYRCPKHGHCCVNYHGKQASMDRKPRKSF